MTPPPGRRHDQQNDFILACMWLIYSVVVDIIAIAAIVVLQYFPGDGAASVGPTGNVSLSPGPADNSSLGPAANICLEPGSLRCILCHPAVGYTLASVFYIIVVLITHLQLLVYYAGRNPAPPNAAAAGAGAGAGAGDRGSRAGPSSAAHASEAASEERNNGGLQETSGRIKIEGKSATNSGPREQMTKLPKAAAGGGRGGGGDRQNRGHNWKRIAFRAMVLFVCINLYIAALEYYIGVHPSLGPLSLASAGQRGIVFLAVQACVLIAAVVLSKLLDDAEPNAAAAMGAHSLGENGEPSNVARLDAPAAPIHGQTGCLVSSARVMRRRDDALPLSEGSASSSPYKRRRS